MTKIKSLIRIMSLVCLFLGIFFMAGCADSNTNPPPVTSHTFTSSAELGHTHTIIIEQVDVNSPPAAGISRRTSTFSYHDHSFTMTAGQLAAVAAGTAVTVVSGSADEGTGAHTHSFSITKWF